ncbi:52 kDa repressor of the inhibitor of the protein kinase [Nephila pilipes]|uniref:52 kDa repressor of the inhibitor of the protein kinase n=1 Tax=Nephila pilipes TaxID=299642 RepID=A0A8X6P9D9_NEPPI|nr:52 kDa repressor of the inhibitor of the protein kinase [Nephila pilipes]
MGRYTTEQLVFIVEQYFKNNESLVTIVRKSRTKYGQDSYLTSSLVKRVIEKLRQTGSIGDAKPSGRPKASRSTVNIEAVSERVSESP